MIIDKNYQRYLMLKEKLNFPFKDIQYNCVLSFDIANLIFQPYQPRVREIVKGLFFTYDMTPLIRACSVSKTLLIYQDDRLDYKYLIEQAISNISDVESFHLKFDYKICFHPFRMLNTFLLTYASLRKSECLRTIFFLSSRIVFYKNIHDQLFSIFHSKTRKELKLISFNSALNIENLLCQIFNVNQYPTYSLSHGFFVSYKKFIPIDIINGENIAANKILVWGSSSVVDLYNHFNFPTNRVLVAGNPKYPLKEIKVKQSFKKCIVLLGRAVYHESNLEIIEIIKSIIKNNPTIEFVLKLHPSLKREIYEEICCDIHIQVLKNNKTLISILEEGCYDFAISNNSTAYYEAMYAGMICFRYEKSENEVFIGLDDKFSNSLTLQNRIEHFKQINNELLDREVEVVLTSTLGIGINKYKQIIEGNQPE